MKNTFLILLLFTINCLPAQTRVDSLLSKFNKNNKDYIFVVAHRADWRNAPENSLQAIHNCIEMGVDMVEIDLKMTKDSVLVLMHDKTIDRTMTGKGEPKDYTLAELKSMNLKSGTGHATRHKIPTLEEVMQIAKDKILVNIDKGYDYFKETYAILQKTGTVRQSIIKAGLPYFKVKSDQGELLNKVIFMPVINLNSPDARNIVNDYQREMKPIVYELVFNDETDDVNSILQLVKQNGSLLFVDSLWPELCGGHDDDVAVESNQPEKSWGWLVKQGVSIIQTDRPNQLIKYLRTRGLHQ